MTLRIETVRTQVLRALGDIPCSSNTPVNGEYYPESRLAWFKHRLDEAIDSVCRQYYLGSHDAYIRSLVRITEDFGYDWHVPTYHVYLLIDSVAEADLAVLPSAQLDYWFEATEPLVNPL